MFIVRRFYNFRKAETSVKDSGLTQVKTHKTNVRSYAAWVIDFKSEVISDLGGNLDAPFVRCEKKTAIN